MSKSKIYSYDYEEYEDGSKSASTMGADIIADPELPSLTELVIGCWGDAWDESCQPVIDALISHADRFSQIEKLFIGDMGYEECEVSWIMQGDYSRLWGAWPNLKELTIKGSTELKLGEIRHEKLETLEIICGGLPKDVIQSIQAAHLPSLKKLLLYIGVEYYGFDGDIDTIRELLAQADFPSLEYLGIVDSEVQDDLTAVVLESKFMEQIHSLNLSCGTLTDKGGQLLLEKLPDFPNIQFLDLHYHYLSNEMMEKLQKLPIKVDVTDQNEPESYQGEIWMDAMLTE